MKDTEDRELVAVMAATIAGPYLALAMEAAARDGIRDGDIVCESAMSLSLTVAVGILKAIDKDLP